MRAKACSSKPKISATRGEIGKLALVHRSVGLGDVEQAVEDVLQHGGIVGEQARDVARVGLEAGDVVLGEIVDAADVLLLAGRDGEDAAERVDLRARHHAVGFRHLGGERDHGDGEGRLAAHLAVGQAGERRAQARRRRRRPCRRRRHSTPAMREKMLIRCGPARKAPHP